MIRVPFSEPPSTIRQEPSALCRSLSDAFSRRGASACEVSVCSIVGGRGRLGRFRNLLAAPETVESGSGRSPHPPVGTIKNLPGLVDCCTGSGRLSLL